MPNGSRMNREVPVRFCERLVGKFHRSTHLIDDISQNFHTSLEASARRVINLSKEPCALIIHADNKMWTPIRSNSFPSFIPKTNFPDYLRSTNYQAARTLPNNLEECDLSDWGLRIGDGQYRCYYSSIYNEEYKRRMTLLFLEEVDEIENPYWEKPHF